MYVKLFASILDSSVWDESPETRLVWITMLVMADEHGFVRGTHQSIARRAVVTPEQATKAIAVLEAPDLRSHTPDHEGRRLEPTDGGWMVLNYAKYRETRTRLQVKEANKKARQRARAREGGDVSPLSPSVPPNASASPSGSVVSSAISEKLNADAQRAYASYPPNTAMDSILEQEAAKRSWVEVGTCLVEMMATSAKWTPYVFRAFLAKIPRPSVGNVAATTTYTEPKPCGDGCDLIAPEGAKRFVPRHVYGCPNA